MDRKILAVVVAAVAIVAVVAVVAFGGLGSHDVPVDENGKAINQPCKEYTITDLAGQTFTFDHTFGAIATNWSISGGPFMTMAALLGDDLTKYLIGIDTTPAAYRADSWNAFCESMPELKKLENIGAVDEGTWDNSKVMLMNPTAIIFSVNNKAAAENNNIPSTFEKVGVPVIYIDFHSQDVEKSAKSIRIIGQLFGVTEKAEKLAKLYEDKSNAIYDKVAEILQTHDRISVYNETAQYSPDKFGKSRNNSQMMGQLLYNCGGNNINENTGTVDSAKVLMDDPEKIFFFGSYWPDNPDSFRVGFGVTSDDVNNGITRYFTQRAGWSDLSAYKNKEVYGIGMCLTRDVYDFISLQYIAHALWPEEFNNIDAEKELEDFYKNWLPFDYGGTWYHQYA